MGALVLATLASLGTVGTVASSQLFLWRDATTHFEQSIGRSLMAPAVLALVACVGGAALLVGTARQRRPLLAWISALLSVLAVVVSLNTTAEFRRRADPRPVLTRYIESFDLGSDATVVMRTSEALPDLPEVRWVYRLPLRKAEACARARAALEGWANPGTVTQLGPQACHLLASRARYVVTVYATPEGAPLTRPPDTTEDWLNTPVHYVVVEVGPCGGEAACARAGISRQVAASSGITSN